MASKKVLSMSLEMSLGVDVSGQDVEKLVEEFVEDHKEELQDLQPEQWPKLAEEIASQEEAILSSSEIKNICSKWSKVQIFIDKYHSNKYV